MGRGGTYNKNNSNKIMRYRIIARLCAAGLSYSVVGKTKHKVEKAIQLHL